MAKVVVLSGAGISAESGISTFRDSDGLWEEYDVKDVCTVGCLDTNRAETIEFYDKRRVELASKEPNKAHKVLATLKEKYGDEIAIITQNVDDLFEKAGLDADSIIHLHGELTKLQCQECGLVYKIGYKKSIESFNGKCPSCFSEKIRPFIVMFGEEAPNYVKLYEALHDCELFVVIGTSGQVISTDDFTQFVKKSVLNNLEPSPAIDDTLYTYVFYEKATSAIDKIAKIVEEQFVKEVELYLPVVTDGLWGVVDTNANIIIPPQYEFLDLNGYFPRNFFKVVRENEYYDDYEYYFINTNNEILSDAIPFKKRRAFTPDYAFTDDKKNMLFALSKEVKSVFYDYDGKEVFATEYDFDERHTLFQGEFHIIKKDEKYGIIDRNAKEIVSPKYAHIILERGKSENCSVAYLRDECDKEQFIDLQSGYISSQKYDALYWHELDLFIAKKDGKWGIVNTKEEWLLEPKCTNIVDENPYVLNSKLVTLLEYDLHCLQAFESFVLHENYITAYDDFTSTIYFLDQDKKQLVLVFA